MEIHNGHLSIIRQEGEEERFIFVKDDYDVVFIPQHFDNGGGGLTTQYMNMSRSIFDVPHSEITTVQAVFEKMEIYMTLYFEICKHQNYDYPYPKDSLQRLYDFNLTEAEAAVVDLRLQEYTFIYLIRDDDSGYTKIGRSDNPEGRLKALIKQATLMPTENRFRILRAWSSLGYMEKVLHQRYADKRIRGEWFDLSNSDIQEIDRRYF